MAKNKEQLNSNSTPDDDQEPIPVEVDEILEPEELAEGEVEATVEGSGNSFLHKLMDSNFIEYASYVIKERAIPDVDDGLKPVQRRILWSLHRMDDGKFHKVANVIGHTMQYHPHGDASIGAALVVLANKEYFIEKQGNFGNIFTGDEASAARYIECRLSHLGREVLYNNDITEFLDSYDGRNKEPVVLPVKIPSLLMLGCEGIAVGMSTKILPHNFNELLQTQIAHLNGEAFEVYPDFLQGGMMDVSEYNEGNGKVILRAKIDHEGRKLVIREIPATTTTESLIASIERAEEKGKIKIASINDYTAGNVEIEVTPTRGYDPEKALSALYAYTDCSVSVSVNMMVIKNHNPVQMTVSEVIKRNTEKLLEYLKRELEIELAKLEDQFHNKTLAQIFIENRIYKRIEECDSNELVFKEVYKGLEPFREMLKRDVVDEDIERLLAIPIRRISLFDINKNRKDIEAILDEIKRVKKHLRNLKKYAISYLQNLLDKYGHLYPRRTVIDEFDKIDRRAAALNNIKVGWDRKNCYIGTNVKSEDQVTCNEFDHLLCLERNGKYKVINIPDKVFIGRLYDFRKYDKDTKFGVIYSDPKTGKSYIKRCSIDKFITDREYHICPEGCRLELFTPRTDAIYKLNMDTRYKDKKVKVINLLDYPERSARARGVLLDSKKLLKVTHDRYLTEEELSAYIEEEPVTEEKVKKSSQEEDKATETAAPKATDAVTTVGKEDKVEASNVKTEKTTVKVEKTTVKASDKVKNGKEAVVEKQNNIKNKTEAVVEKHDKGQEKKQNPLKQKNTESEKQPNKNIKEKAAVEKEEPVAEKAKKQDIKQKTEKVQKPETDAYAAAEESKKAIAEKYIKAEESSKQPVETEKTPDKVIDNSTETIEKENQINKVSANNEELKEQSNNDDDDWGIIQPEFGF